MHNLLMWAKYKLFRLITLLSWISIIIADRQDDHSYLFIILKHKLILMNKFFDSDLAMSAYASKEAAKMRRCILILNRLIKYDYSILSGYNQLDEKWGPIVTQCHPIESKPGFKTLYISRKGVVTPKDKKQLDKDIRRYDRKEVALQKQDVDYLFKLLSKHVNCWWD